MKQSRQQGSERQIRSTSRQPFGRKRRYVKGLGENSSLALGLVKSAGRCERNSSAGSTTGPDPVSAYFIASIGTYLRHPGPWERRRNMNSLSSQFLSGT